MHIVFELDHQVPVGVANMVSKAMNDLAQLVPKCSYEIEINPKILDKHRNDIKIRTKSFTQKKLHSGIYATSLFSRSKINSKVNFYVTITVARIVYRYTVNHGLSQGRQSVISLFNISQLEYSLWSATVWELLLHEIGHMLGLVSPSRICTTRKPNGCTHCTNDCVMCTDSLKKYWYHYSQDRYRNRTPYCSLCSTYIKKSVKRKLY